jgi:hypothetical protein
MPAKVKRRRFPPPWAVEETDACFVIKKNSSFTISPRSACTFLGRFCGERAMASKKPLPERRAGKDRRSGVETRSPEEKKVVGERRVAADRRSGLDRRSEKRFRA